MSQQKQVLLQDKHISTLKISLIAWNISISSFYFGFCLVYLGSLPFLTVVQIYKIDINHAVAQGILNGCIPIGSLFGALGSSFLIRKFSRRKNLLATNAVAFVVGFLVYIPNFYSFLFIRFIQGICVGIFSTLAPLIIRQLSPIKLSGRLGVFVQLNVSGGIFVAYLCTYIMKKISNDPTCQSFWQLLFAIPQPVFIIQSIILIFVFPYETPKYLLLKGKQEQCVALLQLIYKKEYVEQILQQTKNDLKHIESLKNINKQQNLTDDDIPAPPKKSKLAILMAVHIVVLQQFCGVNAINVYCGPILNRTTSGQITILVPSLIAFEKLALTLLGSYIISKFSRKILIQVGTVLQGIASGLITVAFFIQDDQNSTIEGIVVFGLFFFMGIFGLTIGPITWPFAAETVEPKILPFISAAYWIATSVVIVLFPIIKENVLDGNPTILFALFTFWSFGSVVVNRIFIVDTKDKTQQEIREAYINHKVC